MARICSDTGRAGRSDCLRPARIVLGVRIALLAVLIVSGATSASAHPAESVDSLLRSWMSILPAELPENVQRTLEEIPDFSRRFLALGSYIRRSDELSGEWSWTSAEVAAFRRTSEYTEMVADVERVRQIFSDSNPGYTLRVNIDARPLGTQIGKWNSVSSVSRAANEFLDSAEQVILRMQAIDSLGQPGVHHSDWLDSFRLFLQNYIPPDGREPTVAVPGLSRHGQLRAFDFKVYRGRRLIAGAHSATIPTVWDEPGWTRRLFEAATAASPRFVGPLDAPYEPWHYNYDPDRDESSAPPEPPGAAQASGNDD